MKKIFFSVLIISSIGSQCLAQSAFYDVTAGDGNGVRFWQSDAYKIHMGNLSEYHFGPVTDYSIKTNMSGGILGRGWTWGVAGQPPIAAINIQGNMQIAGTFSSYYTYVNNCIDVDNGYTRSNFGSNVYWDDANNFWQVRAIGNNDFSSIIHPNADGLAFITAPSDGNVPKSLTNGQFMSFEKMRIKANGNVGIGISSPSTKLDVNGNFQTYAGGNAGTSGALKLRFVAGAGSTIIQANSDNVWANHDIIINGASAAGGNANQLVVHRSGNVGIGTISPEDPLDITNNYDGKIWNLQVSNEQHDVAGDQGVGIKFKLGADGELSKWSGVLGVGEGAWENYVGLAFYTTGYAPGAQNSEKMRITSNGDVGIGTPSPDSKLAVNGTIHTKEVRVDLIGWPDYVFEPTYNLKPLAEIETYIKENKHLPEVPTAKEMEKNGVQLGEMNMLLLKKVEELTLYVIELKKENDEAAEMNKRLADKIEKIEGKINNKN
jgi:hypothetical protein